MSDEKRGRLEEAVKQIYGDQIEFYARGSKELEKHAINVSVPAVAALTLPEEYAAIVLTSRMDNELQNLLQGALHRQGDADELLFEFNMPFGSFSNKINAACSFGYVSKKMFEALTAARKVRNAYAHSDNPDEATKSKDYVRHAPRLLNLDKDYAAECAGKFRDLRTRSAKVISVTPDQSDIVAVMVQMCDTLGMARTAAAMYRDESPHIPACFGAADMLAISKTLSAARDTKGVL